MNVYAVRRMMDHNLHIGRYGAALKNCYDAACLGDTGTAMRILTDPHLTENDDMEFLSACNTARFVIDSALRRCEGFRERAEELSSENIHAAETLAQALRHTSEIGLYRTGLEDGIRMGSPICMHLRASDMLYPGFSGKHVDRLDEALDLMERASLGHWRPALVMGQMRLAGRYFDRDPEKALEDIARSCRMTDAEPPRNWLRYLTEVPGDTDNDDEPEPGEGHTPSTSPGSRNGTSLRTSQPHGAASPTTPDSPTRADASRTTPSCSARRLSHACTAILAAHPSLCSCSSPPDSGSSTASTDRATS